MAKLVQLLCGFVVLSLGNVRGQTDEDEDYKMAYEELREQWEQREEQVKITEQQRDQCARQLREAISKIVAQASGKPNFNATCSSATRDNGLPTSCPRDIGENTFCTAVPSFGCYCVATPVDGRYLDDAALHCRRHGMELMSVETEEEHAKIADILNSVHRTDFLNFWTSGSYDVFTSQWKWTATGANVLPFQKTTEIDLEEPANYLVIAGSAPFRIFNQVLIADEEERNNYICEDVGPANKIRRLEALIRSKLCPDDVGTNSTCFRIPGHGCYCISELYRTVDESEAVCQAHNMQLVSIESRSEWQELVNFLRANLDARDAYNQLFWTSGRSDGFDRWRWAATGQELGFTNWDAGRPHKQTGDIRHIRIKRASFSWVDTPQVASDGGHWHGHFICESP